MSSSSKPSKRQDLQGIRGIAIISVLLFHFFPDSFPNGYLGVDQFFVLSGFLMCMLLIRAKEESWLSLVTIFYTKRFNRILPLYFAIILLSMISLYNYFPSTAIELNIDSASRALVFVSNRAKNDAENYFEMISISTDIFSHTWSLSVEIQFYFLVPFLFLLGTMLSRKIQYAYYSVIGIASFLYHWNSPDTVAFNSVFARIWQFVIGMIVYLATDPSNKEMYIPLKTSAKNDSKYLHSPVQAHLSCESQNLKKQVLQVIKYILILAFAAVVVHQKNLEASIVRPFTTVLTGFLILVSENDKILSNRVLTYIGDISYSLYLIHWPICAYLKLTNNGDLYALSAGLLVSVILAVLTFESFEKWYLRLPSSSIMTLVAVLFCVNLLVINKDDILDYVELDTIGGNTSRLDGLTDSLTLDDAMKLNHRWNFKEYRDLLSPTCIYERKKTPFGWCRHSGLSPDSKYKLAIIGNSWAANHATLFYQECGGKAQSILQGSETTCEPLYPTKSKASCTQSFQEFLERVEKEQPDYLFILSRFHDAGNPIRSELELDPIYQQMRSQTIKFVKNTYKKVYILNAVPNIAAANTEKVVPLLQQETDPMEIDSTLVDMNYYETARRRYSKLKEDCGEKCEFIDYEPVFFNKTSNTFRFFDERGFLYMTRGLHLSPRGLEHVRPVWKRICEDL